MFNYIFLALLSGFLSGLSFNSYLFSFLIWFSLVPLFLVIKRNNYRLSFLYSYLAAFTYFLSVVYWIGLLTRLGLFFLLIYLSLYWAIPALFIKKFLNKRLNFLFIPFLWVIFEYIRTELGGFGWALFGYSQFKNIILIQVANILGVWSVSFLIVFLNVILFNILEEKNYKKFLSQFLGFLTILLCFLIYGYFSLKAPINNDENFLVSIVQPNIAQEKKWDDSFYQEIKEKLTYLLRKVPSQSLAIFPEASWPYPLEDMGEIEDFARLWGRDILMGLVEKAQDGYFNSSFLVSWQGKILAKYRKIKLVPFGEFIPFRKLLSFIPLITSLGDISAGGEYTLLDYQKTKIACLICFEDTFPGLVREFVRRGAEVLVNITNDAWFKGYPQVLQHLQIAVFRAVEERRYLVRAANTGISCIISPFGKIEKVLEVDGKKIFIEGLLNGKISSLSGRTFYSMWPDIFVYIGVVFCIIGLFCFKREERWR